MWRFRHICHKYVKNRWIFHYTRFQCCGCFLSGFRYTHGLGWSLFHPHSHKSSPAVRMYTAVNRIRTVFEGLPPPWWNCDLYCEIIRQMTSHLMWLDAGSEGDVLEVQLHIYVNKLDKVHAKKPGHRLLLLTLNIPGSTLKKKTKTDYHQIGVFCLKTWTNQTQILFCNVCKNIGHKCIFQLKTREGFSGSFQITVREQCWWLIWDHIRGNLMR